MGRRACSGISANHASMFLDEQLRKLYETAFPKEEQIPWDDLEMTIMMMGPGTFTLQVIFFLFVLVDGNLLDVFHLRRIARLGIGLLIGVADGEDIIQLIVNGDVKAVEEELALLIRKKKAHGTTKTTGA